MKIPLSKPYMNDEIKRKVSDVLDSGYYILGENSKEFEKEFAKYVGVKHGILTNSGTTAIMLSLKSLGVGRGDEIIVPSHTAFPTVEPIFHVGAKPVFCDVDDTYTIDPEKIEGSITEKTKGILPVHLYGHPTNLGRIREIADEHNLLLVEDCCQAHGTEYNGRKVGSFGDVGCFSFYPSKNMTVCGDGGILITDNEEVAERARMLRDHGRKSKYEHDLVGYNLRFNEVQAAVGRIQLKKLDEFNEKRRRNARLYSQCLKDLPLTLPIEKNWAKHVFHLYVVRTEERESLQQYLKNNGIQTGVHYPIPCHLQPAVKDKIEYIRLEITEKIVNHILSLPMFPDLPKDNVNFVCEKIIEFYNQI